MYDGYIHGCQARGETLDPIEYNEYIRGCQVRWETGIRQSFRGQGALTSSAVHMIV